MRILVIDCNSADQLAAALATLTRPVPVPVVSPVTPPQRPIPPLAEPVVENKPPLRRGGRPLSKRPGKPALLNALKRLLAKSAGTKEGRDCAEAALTKILSSFGVERVSAIKPADRRRAIDMMDAVEIPDTEEA